MKVGVVSDSHGNLKALKKALEQMENVDCIIHLGDYVDDGLYLKTLTNVPVYLIKGNMDEHSKEGSGELFMTIENFNFLACHGHLYGVKGNLNTLFHAGIEKNAQVILFGHTHKPFIQQEDSILMMNPGSVGLPHMNDQKSYGIITIENGRIYGEIKEILK